MSFASVGSAGVSTSAGGAFHGHTIESWDVLKQIEALREEVKGAVDDSRRSKLFCQQVMKEVDSLVNTEMDSASKQDNVLFGGISSLLSNTSTLVEKFAKFEEYLREKITDDQKSREQALLEALQQQVDVQLTRLREDVRDTLLTFRREIVELQQVQVASAAECQQRHDRDVAANAAHRNEDRAAWSSELSGALTRAKEARADMQQQLEVSLAQLRREIMTDALDDHRKSHSEQLMSESQSLHNTMAAQTKKMEAALQQSVQLLREEIAKATELASAQAAAHVQKSISTCDTKWGESSSSIKKMISSSIADVRDELEAAVAGFTAKVTSVQTDVRTNVQSAIREDFSKQHVVIQEELSRLKKEVTKSNEDLVALRVSVAQGFEDAANRVSAVGSETTEELGASLKALEQKVKVEQDERDDSIARDIAAIRDNAAATKNDVESLQDVFISVFGAFDRSRTPPESLESTLDRQKHKILQQLIEDHLKSLESKITSNHQDLHATSHAVHTQLREEVSELRSHVRNTHEKSHNAVFEATGDLRSQLAAVQHRLHHNVASINAAHLRNTMRLRTYHTWQLAIKKKKEQRLRTKQVVMNRAYNALQRTVVPQVESTLRRTFFSVWKRYLVVRRAYHRRWRLSCSVQRDASRRVVCRYFSLWMTFVRRTRRPARRVNVLSGRVSRLLIAREWHKWVSFVMTRRRRKLLARDCRLLELARSATGVGATMSATIPISSTWQGEEEHLASTRRPGPSSSSVMISPERHRSHLSSHGGMPYSTISSIALSPSRAQNSSYHRDASLGHHRAIIRVSPRDVSLWRHVFLGWVRLVWRRRFELLRRGLDSVENRSMLHDDEQNKVLRDVQSLKHEQHMFEKRISNLLFRSPSSRRVDMSSSSSPAQHLITSLSHCLQGTESILDILVALGAWVEVVDRMQTSMSKDVTSMQAWMVAIDEEIRRVQKFARPPFK